MSEVKITRNGMTVSCYGKMEEGMNILIIGTEWDGGELETTCCDSFRNWTEAVEAITKWAVKWRVVVEELSAV